jgi:uncharacterized protein (TIGR03435 family)
MRLASSFGAVLLASATLIAQTSPRFEVASIKPSGEQAVGTAGAGFRLAGNQMRVVGLSLRDYVGIAYSLRPAQVVAPEWTATVKYDVTANLPADVARDQLPAMMRALLEERFGLKAHREQREFPVYALTVVKSGLKLRKVADDVPLTPSAAFETGGAGSAQGVNITLPNGGSFSLANLKIEATKISLTQLAEMLTRFSDRTVRDATGVAGLYDITIDLTQEEYQATLIRSAVNAGVVLPPQALRILDIGPANPLGAAFEKAGLSLESSKAPLDVVVVDSMARTPTEN